MSSTPSNGPALKWLAGVEPPRCFGLGRPMTTLGRDSACDIVLPAASVSRRHARIIRRNGRYLLEDLDSTAGTLLNGRPVRGSALLSDGDRIEIGGCLLVFSDPDVVLQTWAAPAPTILSQRGTTEADELARVGVRPEEKLAAVLEISRSLVGALGLGEVLEKVLDALLKIFPGAERGLILLEDEDGAGRLAPAAVRIRREEPSGPEVSQAILQYVLADGQAVLSEDVTTDVRFLSSRSVQEARIRSLICAPCATTRGGRPASFNSTPVTLRPGSRPRISTFWPPLPVRSRWR